MNTAVMNVEALLAQPIFQSVGWALVHFIWQGAFVAVIFAAARTLLAKSSADARYAAACAALLSMFVLPVATAYSVHSSLATSIKEKAATISGAAGINQSPAATDEGFVRPSAPGFAVGREETSPSVIGRWADESFSPFLPALVLVWSVGVTILWLRFFYGWLMIRRLRRGATPADDGWLATLQSVSRRMRVSRPVRLCESALVEVPTVVGWLSPVILVPASALTGLSPRQLEAVLAHELAHIKRHDYLVNLLQTLVETLLFYHPAVWWVSGQVRHEREYACDDAAVAACGGDALPYARALAELEQLRDAAPRLVVAANGGSLLRRIKRLVQIPSPASRPSSATAVVIAVLTLFGLLAGARAATFTNLSETFLTATDAPRVNSAAAVEGPADAAPPQGTAASGARASNDALRDEAAENISRDDVAGEDTEARQAAVSALAGKSGAVVVMDPRTGRVYTVVNQEWALRRGWSPASTIKLVTAVAGLNEKVVDAKESVAVSPKAPKMNLIRALAVSNSDYFGVLGERVGDESLVKYARQLGLGESTGINHPGESAGRVPAHKAETSVGRMSAYGGGFEVTPIQLATLVSAIANGGTLVVPRVPRTPQDNSRFEPQIRRSVGIPRETLGRVVPGMIAAVEYGTGAGASDPARQVAGKTGTFADEGSSVGLFASYAPADEPRLAVVVLTCGQGENGAAAAGVAGAIYRALDRR